MENEQKSTAGHQATTAAKWKLQREAAWKKLLQERKTMFEGLRDQQLSSEELNLRLKTWFDPLYVAYERKFKNKKTTTKF